jgi:hypothetical protein
VVAVVPAGEAEVVDVDEEAFGVDDPQAAAMRPTTATAASPVSDRPRDRRGPGRVREGIVPALIIGGTSLRTGRRPAT